MSRNAYSPVFRSRVLIAVSALVLGGGALAVQPATGSLAAKQSLKKARCHPSYKGACLDPNAYDYDCRGAEETARSTRASCGLSDQMSSASTPTTMGGAANSSRALHP